MGYERISAEEFSRAEGVAPARLGGRSALRALDGWSAERIAILADACGGRRTTSGRLLTRIDELARLRHRQLLVAVLGDIA